MTCQEAVDLMGQAVEDELPPAFRAGFEAHTAECAPCATYLEHLRLTRDALRHLPDESATNPRYRELLEKFQGEFGPRARRRREP
jgi:anti-sigma factor RsiW